MGDLHIGKYRIVGRLGKGGAGVVHRAIQEPLDREVAIKLLLRRHADSRPHLEAFLKEARIATTLQHENIVRGLDYGEADGYHYFAMELVDGESLYEIIQREGHLPERRAFEIARQVASALDHAAGYGLIHRDIKPENIMINAEGVVKLCDLGLARLSVRLGGATGRDDEKVGTAAYMSPEQIRSDQELTFRSDLYSLGATLYHLVTGGPPFVGATPQDVARKHLRTPVVDPRERNLEVSSGAASVIVKMLAKDPADRYASYPDLIRDFDAVLAGRPPLGSIQVGAKIGGLDPAARSLRRTRSGGGRRLLVPALLLALVIAGAAAALLLTSGDGPREPRDVGVAAGTADVQQTPLPEDLDAAAELAARRGLLAVKESLRNAPDMEIEDLTDRYRNVAERYPDTRAGAEASREVEKLDRELASKLRQSESARKAALDARIAEADSLAAQGSYGTAIGLLDDFMTENPGDLVSAAVNRETSRIRREALAHAESLIDGSVELRDRGELGAAREKLRSAPEFGIPEIDGRIRAANDELDALVTRRAAARLENEEDYRLVAGAAIWRAARDEFDAAGKGLADAAEREDLAWFREDLDRLTGQISEVRRFAEALRDGGDGLGGQSLALELIGPSPGQRTIVFRDCTEHGIEVKHPRETEVIPWDEVSSESLIRIAFRAMEPESAEDQRAAVLYLVAHGRFRAADAMMEKLRIAGGRMEGIGETREAFAAYLETRAELEINRAAALRTSGRPEEANEVLMDLVRCVPEAPGARLVLGSALVETDAPEAGLAQLRIARDLGSGDPDLHYWTGSALLDLDRMEEGVASLRTYLLAAPDGPRAGNARERVEELEGAAREQKIEALERKGKTAYRRKDWAAAIDCYAEIEKLAPGSTDAAFYLGAARLRTGETLSGYLTLREYVALAKGSRISEARKEIRSAEKDQAGSPESERLQALGMESLLKHEYADALVVFERAVQAAPLRTDGYLGLAEAAVMLHQQSPRTALLVKARWGLDRVLMLDPEEREVSELLALVLLYQGDHDEALRQANLARDFFPDRWQALSVAGLVQTARGKHALAVHLFSEGIRRAPEEASLYVNRALALEKLERYEESADDLKTAEGKGPTTAERRRIETIRRRLVEAAAGK